MRGVPGWQLTRCIVTTLLRGAESIRMIYRARAGMFFCIFFVFLARVSSGVEKYVVGFQNHFANFFIFYFSSSLKKDTPSSVDFFVLFFPYKLGGQTRSNLRLSGQT
jgi:hypothetical protein